MTITYQSESVRTFFPLKLYILGACVNKAPEPSNISLQELKRMSPRVLTTGSLGSTHLTIDARFCTLYKKEKKISPNILNIFFSLYSIPYI